MIFEPDCVFVVPSFHDGLELDGRLYFPRQVPGNIENLVKGFAIIAHPYAPLGGCWDDPIVRLVGSTLLRVGFIAMTFNFRGASGSAGRTSWTGNAELADYITMYMLALKFMDAPGVIHAFQKHATLGHEQKPLLILAGYSYGSMIASQLPSLQEAESFLGSLDSASFEHEIEIRALELSRTFLNVVDPRIRDDGKGLHNTGVASTPGSPRGVMLGGHASEVGSRRVSRDSIRRSLDAGTVRRSIERVKQHFSSANDMVDIDNNDGANPHLSTGHLSIVPNTAVLLISPLLPPITGLLTLFSRPAFRVKGRAKQLMVTQHHALGSVPSLAIFGDKDVFSSVRNLRTWAEELRSVSNSKFQAKEIKGAGHFWSEDGVKHQLRDDITRWVEGLLKA